MNLETIVLCVSSGIGILNSLFVAGIYLHHIRTVRNVFLKIRADDDGEPEFCDPMNLVH